jgi:hypothetical protein
MSALAKDLIQRLLMKDPKKRLGCGPRDADEIKEHLFFQVKFIEQIGGCTPLLFLGSLECLMNWVNIIPLYLFSPMLHFFFSNDKDSLEGIRILLVET